MWESPIYRIKAEVKGKKTEVLIDVTGSAPRFNEPGKQLKGTFEVLLSGLKPSETRILDFGGAKLRNTLHLLKQGYNVYACEFEDLFRRSRQAHEFLDECRTFSNFHELVFPKDFIDFDATFDVVILVNVINIMPVPIERLCVLALCREKMRERGRLLWYTQHGTYSESDAVGRVYDGLVTGQGREYHMFYRDFSRKEIHDMLSATGFTFSKEFKFPMSGANQAYVFIADGDVLVDQSLGLTEQLRTRSSRELKLVNRRTWKTRQDESDPAKRVYEAEVPTQATKLVGVDLLGSYLEELSGTEAGRANASRYHRLIFNTLKSVLGDRLRKPEIEEVLAGGTQRADITFQNRREKGFFEQLAEGYHVTCPTIFVECKNYEGDIGNPEFSQMQSRLSPTRGQFGIIVCRKIVNKRRARERQLDLRKKGMYVIVLVDSDVKKLVKLKIHGREDDIDDYLEDKFKELV